MRANRLEASSRLTGPRPQLTVTSTDYELNIQIHLDSYYVRVAPRRFSHDHFDLPTGYRTKLLNSLKYVGRSKLFYFFIYIHCTINYFNINEKRKCCTLQFYLLSKGFFNNFIQILKIVYYRRKFLQLANMKFQHVYTRLKSFCLFLLRRGSLIILIILLSIRAKYLKVQLVNSDTI